MAHNTRSILPVIIFMLSLMLPVHSENLERGLKQADNLFQKYCRSDKPLPPKYVAPFKKNMTAILKKSDMVSAISIIDLKRKKTIFHKSEKGYKSTLNLKNMYGGIRHAVKAGNPVYSMKSGKKQAALVWLYPFNKQKGACRQVLAAEISVDNMLQSYGAAGTNDYMITRKNTILFKSTNNLPAKAMASTPFSGYGLHEVTIHVYPKNNIPWLSNLGLRMNLENALSTIKLPIIFIAIIAVVFFLIGQTEKAAQNRLKRIEEELDEGSGNFKSKVFTKANRPYRFVQKPARALSSL